ncbi:50S ribosomal protein L4 [candidate division WWE3 bacterium]|uniref:Large ribosomal subunit protein uL4 n=1 Tax=candidate division WWE3 bacterium TaxID=2053526 RepID=A0A7X9HSP4_UNCKA|nr:50S ribosomal protein L4 [candidate division WWE3 bacterium]
MKVNVINLKGEKIEEVELNNNIFGIKPNEEVLKQYIRVYMSNQRQGTSSVKNRSEVSGGGKKPWAQKHTGRARQGSIRSPIWVHGGVAHGPKPKDWRLCISKNVKELAFKSILSQRMSEKKIMVLDKVKFDKPSTKKFAEAFKKLKVSGSSILVWLKKDEDFLKSVRNIKEITLVNASTLGAFDVIKAKNVLFMKDAVLSIEERYKHEAK